MNERLVARKVPFEVAAEAGKAYWWCACGRSGAQPFRDGSHQHSAIAALRRVADHAGRIRFRACMPTGAEPTCDASHKAL